MNIFSLVASFAAPLLLGSGLCKLLWPPSLSRQESRFVQLFLAIGLGCGVSSLLFFLWILAWSPSQPSFFLLETALAAGIFWWGLRVQAKSSSISACTRLAPTSSRFSRICGIFFGIILLITIAKFVLVVFYHPHGPTPDASAIWNLHARFIERGGDNWREFFAVGTWSHLDYPLLISGFVARSWLFLHSESTLVPISLAFLFTFGPAGLLVTSLAPLAGRSQGYLAGSVLLSVPLFVQVGAWQIADVPLAFFFLATIALVALAYQASEGRWRLLALAGITAGLAGWTKNEGVPFLLLAWAIIFVFCLKFNKPSHRWEEIISFSVGLGAVMLVIGLFKSLSPNNDLVAGNQDIGWWAVLAKLTDGSRYATILQAIFHTIKIRGDWFFPALLLPGYAALVGLSHPRARSLATAFGAALLLLIAVVYFFIYVTTPQGLVWHLENSLSRLQLQLWPAFLLVFFFCIHSPEEIEVLAQNNK